MKARLEKQNHDVSKMKNPEVTEIPLVSQHNPAFSVKEWGAKQGGHPHGHSGGAWTKLV